jgi:hypothetical protein
MDKFWPYLGGIIGGYTLVQAPGLLGLDPFLDIVGAAAMIVFGGAFIVRGVRVMLGK